MIECDDLRPWTIARETDRLGAGAAADLEHATAGGKPGIPMEQAHDRRSLRQQAVALALAVSMDVHKGKLGRRDAPVLDVIAAGRPGAPPRGGSRTAAQ